MIISIKAMKVTKVTLLIWNITKCPPILISIIMIRPGGAACKRLITLRLVISMMAKMMVKRMMMMRWR